MTTPAPYGEWLSPITTKMIVADSVRLGGIALHGERAYWLEGRPWEGGRNVLVCRDAQGTVRDLTPAPLNVRTRAHEYGGGAFLVHDAGIWFVNDEDQRLYQCDGAHAPRALTPPGPWRYADMMLDGHRQRLICVWEAHDEAASEASNTLVTVDLRDGSVRVLAEGHDFYSSPCMSRDGKQLAWLTWDHPHMPWDSSELWVAELADDGALTATRRVAGGGGESVFQPAFRDDGVLFFVSDAQGWWNLHRREGERIRCVLPMEAEFGRPQWQFGMSTYGFDAAQGIVCCYSRGGFWHLARLSAQGGPLEAIDCGFTDIQAIAVGGVHALVIGGAATRASTVALVDTTSGATRVLRESAARTFPEDFVSLAEPIAFASGDGARAHAFYYPPRSPRYCGPSGERPPLIVIGHGGPTGATTATLNLSLQYWTSRGFAVLDVNYRGSTGYGRAYRELLAGHWGIADVEDCVNGARHLAESGCVDGARLIIRGSSAGGYTTLAALVFHDVFAAGASYYGISDLETLARDTHKFESRYLDRLIGPYPAQRRRYLDRSPIHAVERLSCPVIFFQGLEDAVVPPSQAERMVAALRGKGLPVAYLAFEGEQHGFRKADTIERTLQAEFAFYARVFDFSPTDDLPELAIDNL